MRHTGEGLHLLARFVSDAAGDARSAFIDVLMRDLQDAKEDADDDVVASILNKRLHELSQQLSDHRKEAAHVKERIQNKNTMVPDVKGPTHRNVNKKNNWPEKKNPKAKNTLPEPEKKSPSAKQIYYFKEPSQFHNHPQKSSGYFRGQREETAKAKKSSNTAAVIANSPRDDLEHNLRDLLIKGRAEKREKQGRLKNYMNSHVTII